MEYSMKATIWSKNNCTYCVQAKKVLELHQADIEVRMIDGITWTREHLLESVPQARTVPQIFINDEYIGGFNEMVTFLANNKS